MKSILKLFLLILFPTLAFAQAELENTSLLDNKIEMMIPKSLHKMTEAEYKLKYPNPRRKPSLILTNDDARVNLIIDFMQQYNLPDESIAEFKDKQMAAIIARYADAKLLDNGVKEINGKKFGYFRVMTKAADEEIYNYFLFTNLEGKVLLMSFNCSKSLMPHWEKLADKMVGSVKEVE